MAKSSSSAVANQESSINFAHIANMNPIPTGTQQPVVIPATAPHTASVIFIHGLGQSTFTWRAMIIEGLVQKLPHVEWVLPQASEKPVTYSLGRRRSSWFDIATLPPGDHEWDEPAIAESVALVEGLILFQIHRGIDVRRIFLVGFSQGAALSLVTALSTLHDLGGVVSLSGWIPPRARDQTIASPNVPILWCHGTADEDIPLPIAQNSVSFLRRHVNTTPESLVFNTYPGLGHTINDEEVEDLLAWLVERTG